MLPELTLKDKAPGTWKIGTCLLFTYSDVNQCHWPVCSHALFERGWRCLLSECCKSQLRIRSRYPSNTLFCLVMNGEHAGEGFISLRLQCLRYTLEKLKNAGFAKICHLTCARQGGGLFLHPPLWFFCDNSRSYVRIIAKFSTPSKLSISHILTKAKLASFDMSAKNDVKRDVMFSRF